MYRNIYIHICIDIYLCTHMGIYMYGRTLREDCSSWCMCMHIYKPLHVNLFIHARIYAHTAPHCTTMQYTTSQCTALQQIATHFTTLQHTHCTTCIAQSRVTNCNTLQHTATHFNTLQHTATHATHCTSCIAQSHVGHPTFSQETCFIHVRAMTLAGDDHNCFFGGGALRPTPEDLGDLVIRNGLNEVGLWNVSTYVLHHWFECVMWLYWAPGDLDDHELIWHIKLCVVSNIWVSDIKHMSHIKHMSSIKHMFLIKCMCHINTCVVWTYVQRQTCVSYQHTCSICVVWTYV